MRSSVRRPLILSVLLALLLGAVGGAAPAALAATPEHHWPPPATLKGIDLEKATIPQLQKAMDRHKLSSLRLTRFYLERIQTLDHKLHAVLTLNPWALAEARAADKARRRGVDKPLLGIPVLLKDNINTKGMATTAGSWALDGSRPHDAFIVKRLRRAGAVILGKLNLSEWANFRSIPSSSGWSGIGGQTNMPYVLDRNACGSSSGSGVAAAANLATVTVGTETDGSIVCPAGANSVVGIKPTVGLLSRAGIIPISADQDTAGPMTRNVTDAAVMLGVMAGVDPKDPATAAQKGHAFRDYTQFLDKRALRGARIGVWRVGTYDPTISPEVHRILNRSIEVLKQQGATVIDGADIPLTQEIFDDEFTALLCEFNDDIATYLETYTRPRFPKTLQDLLDFNNAHPELEGPWNSEIFVLALATGGRDAADCKEARASTTSATRAAIDQVMATHRLDAIIAPTNGPAWVTNLDPTKGDMDGDFTAFVGSSSAAAISGYASITVPAGFAGKLPIGMSFMAGPWSEPELIGFAYDFERATQARRPPKFIASIGPDGAPAGRRTDPDLRPALIPAR